MLKMASEKWLINLYKLAGIILTAHGSIFSNKITLTIGGIAVVIYEFMLKET